MDILGARELKKETTNTRLSGSKGPVAFANEETSRDSSPSMADHIADERLERSRRQLSCLYAVSKLRDSSGNDLNLFLQKTVEQLPQSWQYPQTAVARILYKGKVFTSPGFVESKWAQVSELTENQMPVGLLEVRYTSELAEADEGPFTHDERQLLDVVARVISRHAERQVAFQALKTSERLFSDIVNFLPDPTFAIDLSGRIIAWNRAMEQSSGIPSVKALGHGDHEYALPYYGTRRPILVDLVLKFDPAVAEQYPTLQVQGDTMMAELTLPRQGKSSLCLWAKASPLYDANGDIVGAIETTRDITEMKNAQQALESATEELEAERQMLEEKNLALREIIRQVDVEKKQLAGQVQGNIDRVVGPLLRSLEAKASPDLKKTVQLVSSYIEDITAPFMDKLERAFQSLSPREMQICSMIRDGMSCKEIAGALGVSVNTVLNQRQRIRRKLRISKRKVNLRSYLKSL